MAYPFTRHQSSPENLKAIQRTRSSAAQSRYESILRGQSGAVDSQRSPPLDGSKSRSPSSSHEKPAGVSQLLRSVSATALEGVSSASTQPPRGRHGQDQYMAQERAYVRKLRHDLVDDYHVKELNPVGQVIDLETEPNLEDEDELELEIAGFGGMGTSFDDAYTDLSSNYKLFEGGTHPVLRNRAKLKERSEWQAMLTSVLTGEVFRSEKSRLKTAPQRNYPGEQEQWLELRAKVTGRSIREQRRLIQVGRSTVSDVLDKIATYRSEGNYNSVNQAYDEITELLSSLAKCENLWPSLKALQAEVSLYAQENIQRRIDALTAWHRTTGSILLELRLLRDWTGNDAIDPSLPPDDDDGKPKTSLVERILKQDDALMSIFESRIRGYLFPLFHKSRETSIEYAHLFVEMGIPLFRTTLEPVIKFPVILIREIIELRLQLARKLVNPTMVIIDQTIVRFQQYMTLGLVLTSEYIDLTRPIFDKGWIVSRKELGSLNSTLLECITFYLELLINKFLDGGKSSLSFFRSFKSIEQLEEHYTFLQETCTLIEGGDISVAERFASLNSRVLSRLLAYWEHQMEGPAKWEKVEIERWFAATIENIRSIQRKLLRFYKTFSDNHENATDYALPKAKMKNFMKYIRDNGFFLVFVGSLEREGIYTFASANLRDQPQTIKNILQGFCRMRSTDNTQPGCVLILTIEEPLVWDGEIYHLDMPTDNIRVARQGKVCLVSQGGHPELMKVREKWSFLEDLDVIVQRKAHLAKVDLELNKVRSLFYRLANTVIQSAQDFRVRVKPYGVPETVQQMFVFAREFGQRGLPIMGESKRGRVALKLIDFCIDWVSFVTEDCPPSEPKTFRWTVVALEFGMVMTRGVNIIAISDEQFTKLRRKVADCMALLISHFDIMGARSQAQQLKPKILPRAKVGNIDLKDDDELIALLRESTLERLNALESSRKPSHLVGKVLDDSNTEFEFLDFASSQRSTASMRWQQGRFIGSGAFGSVYQAQDLDTGTLMAVKEVRFQNHQSIGHILRTIKGEMSALERLSHPNVVQYYGVEVHRERVFIFMEYCDNGSLAKLLEYGRIEDESVTQMYSLQMLEGLAYLHESGIVHRDIKPENILLDHMGVIKFVDFGAAKVIANTPRTIAPENSTRTNTRLGSITGTPMYMSPEMITGKKEGSNGAMDIWSIGCCILEMVTGRRPWANLDNEWAVMYHIAQNHMPTMPTDDQASPACQKFLIRTLERNPLQRPSAMELLNDPWIVDIRAQLLGDVSEELSSAHEE